MEEAKNGQASLWQKIQVLDYHRLMTTLDTKHKQAETVRHFQQQGGLGISTSAFNRWVLQERRIRADFEKSGGDRSASRSRRARSDSEVEEYLKSNSHIVQCLERYCVQSTLMGSGDVEGSALSKVFAEFKKQEKPSEAFDAEQSENVHLVEMIMHRLRGRIEAVKSGMAEVQSIHKSYKSLVSEKKRISNEIRDFSNEDVFYFSEIIIDLGTLYRLTDTAKALETINGFSVGGESDYLRGSFNPRKTVSFGFGGNVSGTERFPPLLITNLLHYEDRNNNVHYHPEGLNEAAIFESYLERINIKLMSENRHIKLLVENYWPHMGSFNRFTNISIVYINPRFDKTIAEFTPTHLLLPHEFGIERIIKTKLKLVLFKVLSKQSDGETADEFFALHGKGVIGVALGVIQALLDSFKNDTMYKELHHLSLLASRLFSVTHDAEYRSERDQFQLDSGTKFSTTLNRSIPDAYRHLIKYNERENCVVLKEHETELKLFVSQLTKAVCRDNKDKVDRIAISQAISSELKSGRNERKLNKSYSIEGIYHMIEALGKFQSQSQDAYRIDGVANASIDSLLLDKIIPHIASAGNDKSNILEAHRNSSMRNSLLSKETQSLFCKFYLSYLNDTYDPSKVGNPGQNPERGLGQDWSTLEPLLAASNDETSPQEPPYTANKRQKRSESSQLYRIRSRLKPSEKSQNSVSSTKAFSIASHQRNASSSNMPRGQHAGDSTSLKYKITFSDDDSSFDSS